MVCGNRYKLGVHLNCSPELQYFHLPKQIELCTKVKACGAECQTHRTLCRIAYCLPDEHTSAHFSTHTHTRDDAEMGYNYNPSPLNPVHALQGMGSRSSGISSFVTFPVAHLSFPRFSTSRDSNRSAGSVSPTLEPDLLPSL